MPLHSGPHVLRMKFAMPTMADEPMCVLFVVTPRCWTRHNASGGLATEDDGKKEGGLDLEACDSKHSRLYRRVRAWPLRKTTVGVLKV